MLPNVDTEVVNKEPERKGPNSIGGTGTRWKVSPVSFHHLELSNQFHDDLCPSWHFHEDMVRWIGATEHSHYFQQIQAIKPKLTLRMQLRMTKICVSANPGAKGLQAGLQKAVL